MPSFHSYGAPKEVRGHLDKLEEYGCPAAVHGAAARHHGAKFRSHAPLFRERNVCIYQLGLVAGRT